MEILGTAFPFSAPLVDRFPAWLQKSSPGSGSGNLTTPLVEPLQKTRTSPRIAAILGPQRKSWGRKGNLNLFGFLWKLQMWIYDNLSSNTLCGKCWSNFGEVFTQASCRHYKYVRACLWRMNVFNIEKNKQQKGNFSTSAPQSYQTNEPLYVVKRLLNWIP